MGNVLELSHWRGEENPDTIRYESLWVIVPMQGSKIEIKMHRTRYWIKSSTRTYFCEKSSTLFLYSKSSFEYQLEFLFPDKSYSRLLLKSVESAPFIINGIEGERVYLQIGDRVKIGMHHFHFPKDKKENDEIKKNLNISSEIIESKLPIYLEGETGTGKTNLAKKLHDKSGALGPFIHLNLSSISSNLFESELFGHKKGSFTGAVNDKDGVFKLANLGTLFLDEINSLSLEFQTKLLLVLENQRFRPIGSVSEVKSEFRLITSSNEPLEGLVAKGKMRKDFYFRITSGEKILLPSLNSSEEYFYSTLDELEYELDIVIPRSLKDLYFNATWEGNIREFKNYLLKKKILQGRKLTYSEIDEELILKNKKVEFVRNDEENNFKTLDELKKEYIRLVYERTGRSVAESSRVLNIAPGTVRAALYEAKM